MVGEEDVIDDLLMGLVGEGDILVEERGGSGKRRVGKGVGERVDGKL